MKLSRLEILRDLYSEIIVPKTVYEEVEAGKNKPYYKDLNQFQWIQIREVADRNSLKFFYDLDAGEAEAIVLAKEINAQLLIIDEKLGRYYAGQAGIKITGTLGVLIKAKNAGFVTQVKPLLIELTQKEVWISENLIAEVCKITNE